MMEGMGRMIVTHDGRFHADEVMAVAILHEYLGDMPVKRTRNVASADLEDPAVWVVDVGMVHDPSKRCFDHHQDAGLPASCKLVADHLLSEGILDVSRHAELDAILTTVSDIDRNGYKSYNGFQFNAFIRLIDEGEAGFEQALSICRLLVKSLAKTALAHEESQRIWDQGELVHRLVRVCSQYPVHWRRFVDECILVYPSGGEWRVISSDNERLPLIAIGTEIFMHQNRFTAGYRTKAEAVLAAVESAEAGGGRDGQ
jgi:uncharacterized UPF0160 family protein